jgi:hypothetical protein
VLLIHKGRESLLHGRSPHFIAHALRICVVVIWLSAVGATNVVVLVVHAGLGVAVLWLRIGIAILGSSRRRNSLLRGRLPAHRRHVRAAVGTGVPARLVVIGRRWGLKDWRGAIATTGV